MIQLPTFDKGQIVVFEGDSHTNRGVPPNKDTWAYLRLMNWQKTWADYFAECLLCWRPELKLTFHNSAVGGSSCRDVYNRLEHAVLPYKPDWVFITLGHNDASQNIPTGEFRKVMSDYVERLKSECNCKVVFISLLKREKDFPHIGFSDVPVFQPYYDVFSQLAEETGNYFIDAASTLYDCAIELYGQAKIHTVFGDGRHLNAVGSLAIAGAVLKAFGIVK